MVRRRFLELTTLAGAGGFAAFASAKASAQKKTVCYKVEGFTCVTCAVGLETLLARERGVLSIKATYPQGVATIVYSARYMDEAHLVAAVESMGFKATAIDRL